MPAAYRLAIFYFAFFAYVGVSAPFLPLYLSARGLDATGIALVLAMPAAARIVAPSFWGWIADRSGARRRVVIFSCLVQVCGFAVLPEMEAAATMAVLFCVMGMLAGGAMPVVETIALTALARTHTTPGSAGRYGHVRLWGSLGFVVGVLGAGLWLDRHEAVTLSALLLATTLTTLVAAMGLPDSRAAAPGSPTAGSQVINSALAVMIAAGFCMAVAHGALYAFFSLHLQTLGHAASTIGWLWTLGVVAEIAVFILLPRLLRRFSLIALLAASLVAAVVRFAAIAWAGESLAVLVFAQMLHALTFGVHHAASVIAVQRLVPEGGHARGQALFSGLSYGAGGAVGSALAGWLWEIWGAAWMFTASAGAALIGAAVIIGLRRVLWKADAHER